MKELFAFIIIWVLCWVVTGRMLLRGVPWRVSMLVPTVASAGTIAFVFWVGGAPVTEIAGYAMAISGVAYGGLLIGWFVVRHGMEPHGMRW